MSTIRLPPFPLCHLQSMVHAAARVTSENVYQSRFPLLLRIFRWPPISTGMTCLQVLPQPQALRAISLSAEPWSCASVLQLSVLWTRGHQTWEAHSQHRNLCRDSFLWPVPFPSPYTTTSCFPKKPSGSLPSPFYRKVRFPLWRTYWAAFLQEDNWNEKPKGLTGVHLGGGRWDEVGRLESQVFWEWPEGSYSWEYRFLTLRVSFAICKRATRCCSWDFSKTQMK